MHWTILVSLIWVVSLKNIEVLAADETLPPERDSTTSGNYYIINCQRANHSEEIHQLLPQTWQSLQLVLADLEQGVASRHGYRSFFKTNANLPLAKQVFRAIADGRPLKTGNPVIECLTLDSASTPQMVSTYNMLCTPQPGQKPQHAAVVPRHGVVALCPNFWKNPHFPGESNCLSVVGRRGKRKFMETGESLGDTRFSILLHELVHLYNPLDSAARTAEVYEAQQCVDLDEHASVANAENWAYYAACATRFPPPSFKIVI
ncbi:MAG: hypothetical protein Q9220_001607 [cf. Caloplaca sp. 1 TL-2023]